MIDIKKTIHNFVFFVNEPNALILLVDVFLCHFKVSVLHCFPVGSANRSRLCCEMAKLRHSRCSAQRSEPAASFCSALRL